MFPIFISKSNIFTNDKNILSLGFIILVFEKKLLNSNLIWIKKLDFMIYINQLNLFADLILR
jgi:hypothetical protein